MFVYVRGVGVKTRATHTVTIPPPTKFPSKVRCYSATQIDDAFHQEVPMPTVKGKKYPYTKAGKKAAAKAKKKGSKKK